MHHATPSILTLPNGKKPQRKREYAAAPLPTSPKRREPTPDEKRDHAAYLKDGQPPTGWVHPNTSIPFHRYLPLNARIGELKNIIGNKPEGWRKPVYGNLDYIIAWRMGWISDEDEKRDRAAYEIRRERSLKSCHTPSLHYWRGDWEECMERGVSTSRTMPHQTGAYVPEVPAHLLHDADLSDGARRCMMKILEETYRMNRDNRWLAITVPYLMKALSRSRRTIQNYLRLLELCGYISCEVLLNTATRMCNGLRINLMELAFAKHHRKKWPIKQWTQHFADDELKETLPENGGNSEAQLSTLNYFRNIYIYKDIKSTSVILWAVKCMTAAHNRFMQNKPPLPQ